MRIKDLFKAFNEPHERLFVQREYEAVKGPQVFGLLLVIICATLFTIVLAQSGMAHLRSRMEDPFTSLVSINVRNARNGVNYDSIQHYLQHCADKKLFNSRKTSGNYVELWQFHTEQNAGDELAMVVSFSFWRDRDVLRRVLDPENVVSDLVPGGAAMLTTEAFRGGIIISKEFLEELDCDEEALRTKRLLAVVGGYTVPLRVLAVVHTLPERARCLAEHALVMDLRDERGRNVFPFKAYGALRILVDESFEVHEDTEQLLSSFFGEEVRVEAEPVDDVISHSRAMRVTRANGGKWTTTDKQYWHNKLTDPAQNPIRHLRPVVWFEDVRLRLPDSTEVFGTNDPEEYYRFDQLSITFQPLDSIVDFQRDLQERTRIRDESSGKWSQPVELDLYRVEAQKNFAMVAGLSSFLLLALVLFALMAIQLYLYNLLRNHLSRMKMNLGTFMAFGLSPAFLQAGYLRIILMLLLRVVGVAILVLFMCQALLALLEVIGVKLPGVLQHFSVLSNPWLLACIVAMLASSIFIGQRQLSKFLAIPPGDLIFDRK